MIVKFIKHLTTIKSTESSLMIIPKVAESVCIDGIIYKVDSVCHNFDLNCVQVYLKDLKN